MAEIQGTKATYYHYQLIKKINIHRQMLWSYYSLPIIMLAFLLVLTWTSLFLFLLALPVMMWIHFVVSSLVLYVSGNSSRKRWKYSWKFPWQGYMPEQYIKYVLFNRMQFHMLWAGFFITAVFLFWSPPVFTISLIFWHLWLLMPRLYTLIQLRRERKDGMLKFNPGDVSYYQQ
ncbi:hypothetical protein D3C74_96950 [compost metagenome]